MYDRSDFQSNPFPGEPVTVMIVEDERYSRQALASLLNACGYPIQAVASAEEALRLLKLGAIPRVVLVDLDLPGMNGLQLLALVSKNYERVYPVLITANDTDTVREAVKQRGMTYLRKPIIFDELLEVLQRAAPSSLNSRSEKSAFSRHI